MKSNNKLIKALRVIQDNCENEVCADCPLSCGPLCLVKENVPADWDICETPIMKLMK